jgi:two-component system phosphate regulon sensor histidine kinase PhoR
MVNAEPGGSSENTGGRRARERVYAARHVLFGAVALLLIGALLFDMPLAFALAASAALVIVAALPLRSRVLQAGRDARRASLQVWPDTSMKATVEALPRPAFILDVAGTVRYGNQQATTLFPATRAGDPFTNTFRRPEFADALDDAAAGQPASVEFREPGAATSYLTHLSPLSSPGGGVGFILISFDDVSDRLAIARMRADFVANASHELRTPLAALTGFIETLLGSARNDPVASEKFLHVMMDQARRMRRLIDDLLSLSRAEMRAHNRPTGKVDLVGVLRHVGDAMRPLAAEHSVVLSLNGPKEGQVMVTGDHDELVQVVQNLVENAIRYGASGERVDLALELKPNGQPHAAIHVKDYGPGIAAEHIPRLTERFYRVDVGASREMKGTGLGLAIVKHILTRHSGELDITSQPGQGATFTVTLPLLPERADRKQEIQAAS